MRTVALGLAIALAAGSISVAHATAVNLVTNGTFSATSPTPSGPWEFGTVSWSKFALNGGTCGPLDKGGFVDGWTGNKGYMIWYPSASAASGTQACTQWGNTGHQLLPDAITAPPNGATSFIGLDGAESYRGGVSQTIDGLTPGQKYTVAFDWGSTQEMSETGPTKEQFQVSLGNESYLTGENSIGTHGWSGWSPASFTFTAGSVSAVLNFLSVGTPGNLPPFGVLANVSMVRNVPEPSELGMFGAGLLGLGLLTVFARRRSLRSKDADAA